MFLTYSYMDAHACTHARMHTCTHAGIHACTPAGPHARARTPARMYAYTMCVYAGMHMRMYADVCSVSVTMIMICQHCKQEPWRGLIYIGAGLSAIVATFAPITTAALLAGSGSRAERRMGGTGAGGPSRVSGEARSADLPTPFRLVVGGASDSSRCTYLFHQVEDISTVSASHHIQLKHLARRKRLSLHLVQHIRSFTRPQDVL